MAMAQLCIIKKKPKYNPVEIFLHAEVAEKPTIPTPWRVLVFAGENENSLLRE